MQLMKTLKVTLDYGRMGLPVELPAERVVGPLTIGDVTPLEDPEKAVAAALETPIGTPPLARLPGVATAPVSSSATSPGRYPIARSWAPC